MPRFGKTVKISGKQKPPYSTALTDVSAEAKRPLRASYAQPTTEFPNTSFGSHGMASSNRIEDVFIPFYDRPGYATDNAAQQSMNGRMFKIPESNGRMEERDLGA